jgi:isocitrate dehydrogenase (NAD+)
MYREGDTLTGDVGGEASTSEFAEALADRVAHHVEA